MSLLLSPQHCVIPHHRLCQDMVGTGIWHDPCPAKESVVCGGTPCHRREGRPSWGLAAHACHKQQVLHLGVTASHSQHCHRGVPQGVHKHTDSYHVFLIPRLHSPLWLCMFYKLPNFVLNIPPGSEYWPSSMHKPLFIGISLPMFSRSPWTLRTMPL